MFCTPTYRKDHCVDISLRNVSFKEICVLIYQWVSKSDGLKKFFIENLKPV